VELIVVDNNSTDDTPSIVKQAKLPFPVRYVFEGRTGTSNARNAGLAAARHNILLWTDDDILVPRDWIGPMTTPIAAGTTDIVAGGVRLAPHLQRPWMKPWQASLFASTARLQEGPLMDAVGANMAFGRHVLAAVNEFDPEATYCEESHFIERLYRLGYRITPAFDAEVEHHFDPSRLTHASFVTAMQRLGRAQAYLHYHWRHHDGVFRESSARTRGRIALLRAKYALKQMIHSRISADEEGMETWESYYVRTIAYLRQSLIERRRPRRYSVKHGARRDDSSGSPSTTVPSSFTPQSVVD
jgi:glycosyltransferase involved in cell wall biosynthesis